MSTPNNDNDNNNKGNDDDKSFNKLERRNANYERRKQVNVKELHKTWDIELNGERKKQTDSKRRKKPNNYLPAKKEIVQKHK